ncbi:CocE/NonD family hydrolase [Streptomyces sp. NPDC051322]|uniref:CocE/NonD family hydrolase n=1 Tax=Streptomyces sp. NPDC051322 TaxID=3154645 RepID=UPI003451106B
MSGTELRLRTDFPYETRREDVWIPLTDGTQLYARIWRPIAEEPVPALLEYLPYRLSDWTAPQDWQRHPWYAGHGYASVRVDVRGHGNSTGLAGDEYDAQELADGVAVVEWLAEQPWCTGRVGMFGICWGGFNSLQIASLAPEPLKAVVAVCCSDDRYDNDVHYMGGSVLAIDMHAWAATMLTHVSRPPDPARVGSVWRDMWLNRLESVDPFLHTWLAHQTRDAYWKHGSVCEDYSSVRAPVLAVGGWHDPYRDAVLRLVEQLDPSRVRGLIGPWSHHYPDKGRPPGPAIGFLQETLRWWDHHLKGEETGVMAEPLLRCWISESHPPATTYPELPGRWVSEPSWPSPHVTPVSYALQGEPMPVNSPQHTGLDAGRFYPYGNESDLPPDQREEDAKSVCFEFPVRQAPIEILGRPSVHLTVRCTVHTGQVIARLCDVAPDGSSTLVTRGALNFSARHSRSRSDAWEPGSTEPVAFELNAIGHTFPPGHRIRLAVSSAYWPWIWPQPDSAKGWTLDPAASTLELPIRAPVTEDHITFDIPEESPPLPVIRPDRARHDRPQRRVVRDVAERTWRLEVDPQYGGTRIYPDGLEYTEDVLDTYTIHETDPLSAHTHSDWAVRLHRPETGWDVRIETHSDITCDAQDFITSNEVVCREGDTVVFQRSWAKRIPRTAG